MKYFLEKEALIVAIVLLLIVIPVAYAGFFDFLKGDITGRTSQSLSASISIGNNAPNISDVELAGQTLAPSSGGMRIVQASFLANDAEGTSNLDNSTAKLNVSYVSLTGAGTLSNENTSCTSANIDSDTINYTCEIQMQYFWDHATAWTVDAEVKDSNNNIALNSSNQASDGLNWTYSELVASNFSDSSLAWASATPGNTNQTSSTNQTMENIGNSLSLQIETTVVDLSTSGSATYIPSGNVSIFNITNTDKIECDLLNQSATATPGANPLIGVNNTAILWLKNTLRRGAGTHPENANYCIFDVPADLANSVYNTDSGGNWDLTTGDSGE